MSTTSGDEDVLGQEDDVPTLGWECGTLLEAAAAEEANFSMQHPSEHVDFGHPDPPKLQIFPVAALSMTLSGNDAATPPDTPEEAVLAVAYTDHCVVAQVLTHGFACPSSEVLVVGNLPLLEVDDDDEDEEPANETIHCLTMVARESLAFLDKTDDTHSEDPTHASMDTSPDEEDSTQHDPTASPLPQEFLLAIVVGTSDARVYSAEVLVTLTTFSDGPMEISLSFSPTLVARSTNYVEVLPPDDEDTVHMLKRYGRRHRDVPVEPFTPTGKVLSIVPFRFKVSSGPVDNSLFGTFLWISYQDGNLVRLYHAAVFPSVWEIGAARSVSLEDLLRPVAGFDSIAGGNPVVRCQLMLPNKESSDLQIIPLPRHHPSPLAPLPLSNQRLDADTGVDSLDDNNKEDARNKETVEAIVFGCKDDPLMPSLVLFSSEDQMVGRIKGDVDARDGDTNRADSLVSSVVGSTKAVVEGVAGVFWWGLGSSSVLQRLNSAAASMPDYNDDDSDAEERDELPVTPFPSLWRPPTLLFAAHEFHDAPREMESCVIDPNGRLAALTDSLGRVLLMDLSTKQIIRMWKGFRETSCHWLQSKGQGINLSTTHLVIHSRHRRVLEIWRIVQGLRVHLVQVDRDALVVSSPMVGRCDGPSNEVQTFLLHSVVPGGANRMEKLNLLQGSESRKLSHGGISGTGAGSSRGAALRLQHLRQILSATDLQYTKNDILEAVRMIKSLGDLATALDLIGKASVLEERFGVEGSSFQKSILEYCEETLSAARKDGSDEARFSPTTRLLRRKLNFYARLVKAYDMIVSLEMTSHDQPTDASGNGAFVEEATGWASTFEKVTGSPITDTGEARKEQALRFSAFASSVVYPDNDDKPGDKMQIYFSDSTRTRLDIEIHVFKPLLGWFSSGVVAQFFDVLKIKDDATYVQKCYGEWFMTLSKEQMLQNGLSIPDSPMNRFLEEMVETQVTSGDDTPLDALFRFCCESTDLIRAFLLATLCRRAIVTTASRTSSGRRSNKVETSRELLTFDWDIVLRKLRVCLLVSLRLHGQRLGALPLSVYNLEVENEFSVYEWLARDELTVSHRHDEISILEEACRISTYAFDPFSEKGDALSMVSNLQKACLGSSTGTDLPGDGAGSTSLLLYFSRFSNGPILAAHRCLSLASAWLKSPHELTLLADSLDAAQALTGQPSLALAVRLELWSRVVCPLYRARLFGFVDVPELAEEEFSDILQQRNWLQEFGRLSLRILDLLNEIEWSEELSTYKLPESSDESDAWPPLRPDYILERLIHKIRPLDESAQDAHTVVIAGLLVSDDIGALAPCVPAIYDCFLSLSIFHPVTVPPSPSPEQDKFLASAILLQARTYTGPPLENFRLAELAILGEKWCFSIATLRSLYLLAMYEFGKDSLVDDLLTRAFPQIDAMRFLDGGLDIACRRLDLLFRSDFMKSRPMRELMGVLDADLCDWVQQQAALSEDNPVYEFSDPVVGLGATHVLTLRLLSLSQTANVDTTLRVKIHSLAVMSGTLLKEIQEIHRQQG